MMKIPLITMIRGYSLAAAVIQPVAHVHVYEEIPYTKAPIK